MNKPKDNDYLLWKDPQRDVSAEWPMRYTSQWWWRVASLIGIFAFIGIIALLIWLGLPDRIEA